jgi:hypothetical protein
MSCKRTAFFAAADTDDDASVGTSYDATKYSVHVLALDGKPRAYFIGVDVDVTSISSATKITMRISADAAGDNVIVPDTEATISTGITTATVGRASIEIDREFDVPGLTSDTVYVHCKTDAGTVTVTKVTVIQGI